MLALAVHNPARRRAAPLPAVAEDLGLSLPHLEAIARLLRQAGLIRSLRGPGGGYVLHRPLEEITLADIVEAIDPEVLRAVGGPNLPKDTGSNRSSALNISRAMFRSLRKTLHDDLQSMRLSDFLSPEQRQQIDFSKMPASVEGAVPHGEEGGSDEDPAQQATCEAVAGQDGGGDPSAALGSDRASDRESDRESDHAPDALSTASAGGSGLFNYGH